MLLPVEKDSERLLNQVDVDCKKLVVLVTVSISMIRYATSANISLPSVNASKLVQISNKVQQVCDHGSGQESGQHDLS